MHNDLKTLRNFLEIPYDRLEQLNLKAKRKRLSDFPERELKKYYLNYLKKEKLIKAVTIGFSDLEGRFHRLDYDKKFFLTNYKNLTFDGSSIRGFADQAESDLRLKVDWGAFWWLPSDVFGPGKVLIMGEVFGRDGKPYNMDTRGLLKAYARKLKKERGYLIFAANEIEGFLLKGVEAEANYNERLGFEIVSYSGYYHSLPNDVLKIFIDHTAEAQRAMGFENEKDHPEVAPSQFRLDYSYSEVVNAADQVQIYKLVARQVANNMGLTATFLPKPIVGINGSGMHTNISISKAGKNIFYDLHGQANLSETGWTFIRRILSNASDICLILNGSVNAYRRLDPHFEAPNEIKVSKVDRGAMIRIPLFSEKSARIEVRSVGPDANPYLVMLALVKVGLEGKIKENSRGKKPRAKFLPTNIYTAIQQFRSSETVKKLFGEMLQKKYLILKRKAANRSPLELGTKVKNGEVLYHHEIYNQMLWNEF